VSKIGPSQQAVLAWLKEHPSSTPQEIGDALYETVSSFPWKNQGWSEEHARNKRLLWAKRVCRTLKKRALIRGNGFYLYTWQWRYVVVEV